MYLIMYIFVVTIKTNKMNIETAGKVKSLLDELFILRMNVENMDIALKSPVLGDVCYKKHPDRLVNLCVSNDDLIAVLCLVRDMSLSKIAQLEKELEELK